MPLLLHPSPSMAQVVMDADRGPYGSKDRDGENPGKEYARLTIQSGEHHGD